MVSNVDSGLDQSKNILQTQQTRNEENEGAWEELTASIQTSSRANTAFHLLVKMHKAFSGFIQSASYWQVLCWQLWKTSLTKRKHNVFAKEQKDMHGF